MTDLDQSTYSGEFGFLIVELAAGDPGSYDREVLLASHLGRAVGQHAGHSKRAAAR